MTPAHDAAAAGKLTGASASAPANSPTGTARFVRSATCRKFNRLEPALRELHDFGQEAEAKLVLWQAKGIGVNASYVELFQNWGRESAWLNTVGLGCADQPAYATGAHRSRLVELLKPGHYEVPPVAGGDGPDRTWIDLGGRTTRTMPARIPTMVAGARRCPIAR